MRKSLVQAVKNRLDAAQKLCTKCMQFLPRTQLSPITQSFAQRFPNVLPDFMHITSPVFTAVTADLCPLSTALIKNNNLYKRNYL